MGWKRVIPEHDIFAEYAANMVKADCRTWAQYLEAIDQNLDFPFWVTADSQLTERPTINYMAFMLRSGEKYWELLKHDQRTAIEQTLSCVKEAMLYSISLVGKGAKPVNVEGSIKFAQDYSSLVEDDISFTYSYSHAAENIAPVAESVTTLSPV